MAVLIPQSTKQSMIFHCLKHHYPLGCSPSPHSLPLLPTAAYMSLVCCLQLLGLKSFRTGAVMLAGLLLYDVFWVFGSKSVIGDNVMLTVATSDIVSGPTRLLFPRIAGGSGEASNFPFSLLGESTLPSMGAFTSHSCSSTPPFNCSSCCNYTGQQAHWCHMYNCLKELKSLSHHVLFCTMLHYCM